MEVQSRAVTAVWVLLIVVGFREVSCCLRLPKLTNIVSKNKGSDPVELVSEEWQCGLCGPLIDVKLHVRNDVVEPRFEESLHMKGINRRQLIYHLLEAANHKKAFRFSMKHYGPELGMMVESFHGLHNDWVNNKSYWKILYTNGTALDKGVSTFIAEHNDEIIFEYTRYN